MASNPMFQWPQGQHPEDEPEERQIGVDPFSLRQFSRLDIDRPLPIPSVSVVNGRHNPNPMPPPPAPAPARYASASTSASVPCSRQASPTRWDAHLALAQETRVVVPGACPASRALSRSKSCAELSDADNEFDVILSSPERRASAPQRWGSDVPLIADAGNGGRKKNNSGRIRKGNNNNDKLHGEAPFGCCLYLPGLARRTASKPPPTPAATPTAARASPGYFSAALRGPEAVVGQPELADQCCARPSSTAAPARESTMSLAVSMEGFDCRFSSRSSMGMGFAQLDGGEASSSSYFDLPMELILGCDGDDEEGELPVHAAFLFDSDGIRKSVLRKGVGRAARPSSAQVPAVDASGAGRMSARHVRFSMTSSGAAPSTAADS